MVFGTPLSAKYGKYFNFHASSAIDTRLYFQTGDLQTKIFLYYFQIYYRRKFSFYLLEWSGVKGHTPGYNLSIVTLT